MVQSGRITFYTFPFSQYAHRVRLALEETHAEYTPYVVNLAAKPEWFTARVNPAGTVPALSFGGPECAPDDPSPAAATVTESLVILEFLADIFPDGNILPTDPVERARVRLFVAYFEAKFVEGAFNAVFMRGESTRVILDALVDLQDRLPATGFACGSWSMAEMAAAPFLVRTWMMLEHEIGKYPLGEGKEAIAALRTDKYARVVGYVEDIKAHPSFKNTWVEEEQLEAWMHYLAVQRG